MRELLVVVVEAAGALRRELAAEGSYGIDDHVRSYLLGKIHTYEAVERILRRAMRNEE